MTCICPVGVLTMNGIPGPTPGGTVTCIGCIILHSAGSFVWLEFAAVGRPSVCSANDGWTVVTQVALLSARHWFTRGFQSVVLRGPEIVRCQGNGGGAFRHSRTYAGSKMTVSSISNSGSDTV